MVDFRYHVVSLFAVLVALAAGIVLGSGPLDERLQTTVGGQTKALEQHRRELRGQLAELRAQGRLDDAFADQVAGPLTVDQLASRTVAVFALPGVPPDLLAATADDLEQSGATVVTTVRLTADYLDPAKARSPLEDLALRLVPPGVEFADGSSPIERVGTVLARATVTSDPEVTEPDQAAAEVLAGLQELGALKVTGAAGQRAELAVVVAPAAPALPTGSRAARDGATAAVTGLAVALDAGSRGTVLTGPRGSAAKGGYVAMLRTARTTDERAGGVSTVDTAGRPLGRIALVLALVEQMHEGSGAYGGGRGADTPVPDLLGGDQGS